MKHVIILALVVCCFSSKAQQTSESAFAKSYSFEYETQYAKAITALSELHIESYQINLRLGWLYYLSKDYIKSEQYYRKAVASEPASIEARFGLVLPLSTLGNWNNVLSVYLEITKLDANNSIANYRLASIYYILNLKRPFNKFLTYLAYYLKLFF